MRILVTGGAGFIGSNFIRYILKKYQKYKVINLDKLTYAGNLDNLKDIRKNKRYKFVKGDICNRHVVNKLVSKNDVVINFAAETHVDRSIATPESFIKTDVFGTFNLLEASKKYKTKRFVQISTDEVYGSIEKGSFKETSSLKPNSPYSSSKAGADMLALSYFVTYGVPVIITRSSNNYGPYQYPEKMIPLFITNAIENRKLPLYGDGKNVRDWIYVMDNCRAIDAVLHKGKPGEIYNIGSGNEITNIELTKNVLKILKKPNTFIERVKDRPGHDKRYSMDCSKLKKATGFKASVDFNKSIESTIIWYIANKKWWGKIKRNKFQQYYKKQYKMQ